MLSSELAKDDPLYLPSLRYEIHCLSTLLSILSPKLGSATPHPTRGRHAETVDDLLIHFATVLNIDTENNLVLALSGSPTSIFNMSLMVTTEQTSDVEGVFLYFMPTLITSRLWHRCIRAMCVLTFVYPGISLHLSFFSVMIDQGIEEGFSIYQTPLTRDKPQTEAKWDLNLAKMKLCIWPGVQTSGHTHTCGISCSRVVFYSARGISWCNSEMGCQIMRFSNSSEVEDVPRIQSGHPWSVEVL